jgi:hypothetical protein
LPRSGSVGFLVLEKRFFASLWTTEHSAFEGSASGNDQIEDEDDDEGRVRLGAATPPAVPTQIPPWHGQNLPFRLCK